MSGSWKDFFAAVIGTLIPLTVFWWSWRDRMQKEEDKAVKTALQSQANKAAIDLLTLNLEHGLEMIDYRLDTVEKYLDKTSSFQAQYLPNNKFYRKKKQQKQDTNPDS